MKSNKKLRARAPFLGWPSFVARQPAQLKTVVAGLVESLHWRPEEIDAGWRFQLGLVLGWAVSNVPHYRDSAEWLNRLQRVQRSGTNFWEEWRDIPVLKKTDLRLAGSSFHQTRLPLHHSPTESVVTSGSTGTPVETLNTAITRLTWDALTLRDHLVWRRDFGRTMGAIRYLPPEAQGPEGVRMRDWGWPVRAMFKSAPGGAIHVGQPPSVHAAWLRRLNPAYLLTYPSIAERLLDEMGASGRPSALREIRFMSEPLDAALKKRLLAEWDVRCADMYSANETGHLALSCPEHGKLHVQNETVCLEVLDDDGGHCEAGETGRVVVTPLHNLASPLIRYDLGDYATVGEPCPCGRAGPIIDQVMGRVRNYAVAPDGSRFWPNSLAKVRKVDAVLQFQYVQSSAEAITLKVVVARPLTDDDESCLIEAVRAALGHPYRVNIEPVPSVERGPAGKFEEFLSLIDREQIRQ